MTNSKLNAAIRAKKDEFFTSLYSVAEELKHYSPCFKDKIIFCNCNDAGSAFWKYFHLNFSMLGLKKLIATRFDTKNPAYMVEYIGGNDDDIVSGVIKQLAGNGDFRNAECIELLKESDIVVTNPPFSLFNEYVAQLVEYNKKFIIIGNQNAVTYKNIFPLIKNNEMWLGYGFSGNAAYFINEKYIDYATSSQHKEGMIRVSGVTWYTNIDTGRHIDFLPLTEHYSPEKYPHYVDYDAIEVNKTSDIPCDYNGIMGVPISFIHKYNSEQFEIVGFFQKPSIYLPEQGKTKRVYKRLLIRKKENTLL